MDRQPQPPLAEAIIQTRAPDDLADRALDPSKVQANAAGRERLVELLQGRVGLRVEPDREDSSGRDGVGEVLELAVTTPASPVRAPAWALTAVRENPPATGKP